MPIDRHHAPCDHADMADHADHADHADMASRAPGYQSTRAFTGECSPGVETSLPGSAAAGSGAARQPRQSSGDTYPASGHGATILDPAPRTVLVMRALPGLGDLLCATPALRALRVALPQARITLLGLPESRGLVARYPHLVDEFLDFPGFPGLPEASTNVMALPGFLRAVQGRFDLALQMHGNGTVSNILVQLLGARRAAGFHAPALPCPDPASFAPYPQDQPEPLVWLALLRFLGVPAQGQQLEFPLGPGDEAELAAVLQEAGIAADARLALLHVGASELQRRLGPDLLARIADGLALRGFQVVLTGNGDERPVASAVQALASRRPTDLSGRSSVGALAALVRRAQLVVTGDTGVSHLASALRTPSVVVFLASDVRRWAPLDRTRHHVLDFSATPPSSDAILAEADAVLAQIGTDPLAEIRTDPPAAVPAGMRGARRVLVVPPVSGPTELGPALRRLRATLPDATLVLLAEHADGDDGDATLVDEVVSIGGPMGFNLDDLPALIERLAAARLDAALVFTAEGETAFEAAYVAYLAGVPLRAGLGAEFGGGVLSSWVRPPPDGCVAAERHLFLLSQLGL